MRLQAIMNQHPDSDPLHDGDRVCDSLATTVDANVINHRQQHQPAISARRASSHDDGDDQAGVMTAVSNAVHLSGIELVGIETPRENPQAPDWSPESADAYHLSGTTTSTRQIRTLG
jgi:hypothetical protein